MSEEIADTPDADLSDFAKTAKDLFAGACGGIAQVLIGQPFDIVKVRLQTTTTHSNALSTARSIWTHEGPRAFYKGTLTPLIGIGACVSVQFGAFHTARRWFEGRNIIASHPAQLSYAQLYASGAFAGVTNSVLAGPIEHVRIRLQTQPHAATASQRLYSGPVACIRALVGQAGVANGLYRGQAVTVLREAQAYGMWFLTYEFLMNADVKRRGLSGRGEVEAWRLALYGGLAGEMLWLGSYPLDTVKSKMQSDGLIAANKTSGVVESEARQMARKQFGTVRYPSMRSCFASIWAEHGLIGFYRGLGPTLLRAMPVSGATFFVAEMTLRAIT